MEMDPRLGSIRTAMRCAPNFFLAALTSAASTASITISLEMPFSLLIWSITMIKSWFIVPCLRNINSLKGPSGL
jgi:hypothetical protein